MHGGADDRRNACVVCLPKSGANPLGHENVTLHEIAHRLALIKGAHFGGDYEPDAGRDSRKSYFVPGDTLELNEARRLGIEGEQDLFGGVVPYAFVATKTITHPLVARHAHAPAGWARAFALEIGEAVLPGISAFTLDDARVAGRRLLARGPVRVKLATGSGGHGQAVARDSAQLENALREFESDGEIAQGVVVEQNLDDLATLSVGQARVGDVLITYHGAQRLTADNYGVQVYGGSDLVVVRGDFEALMLLQMSDHVRIAIAQARAYHGAAWRFYAGLFASRRNYDVAQGLDPTGRWRSGVLEQSWRVGGASGAELAAIQAFVHDPRLRVVRASTTEAMANQSSFLRMRHFITRASTRMWGA